MSAEGQSTEQRINALIDRLEKKVSKIDEFDKKISKLIETVEHFRRIRASVRERLGCAGVLLVLTLGGFGVLAWQLLVTAVSWPQLIGVLVLCLLWSGLSLGAFWFTSRLR